MEAAEREGSWEAQFSPCSRSLSAMCTQLFCTEEEFTLERGAREREAEGEAPE